MSYISGSSAPSLCLYHLCARAASLAFNVVQRRACGSLCLNDRISEHVCAALHLCLLNRPSCPCSKSEEHTGWKTEPSCMSSSGAWHMCQCRRAVWARAQRGQNRYSEWSKGKELSWFTQDSTCELKSFSLVVKQWLFIFLFLFFFFFC